VLVLQAACIWTGEQDIFKPRVQAFCSRDPRIR
jgi:hypothetical protein